MTQGLVYRTLSYQVLGACFQVYRTIGPYYQEAVYRRCLRSELRHREIAFREEVPVELFYRGECVGKGFADLVVEDRLILELKAVERIHPQHVAQVLRYLAASRLKLGILVNFGASDKLEYKRVVL